MASILAGIRDLDRLRQIVVVLGRHGFGEVVKRTGLGSLLPGDAKGTPAVSLAVRLRLVLTELGPSAVKLGQILSTRPDLLPEDVITELTKLQDAVPPLPFAQLKGQLEEALGAPIADVYEEIDEKPLASASIGQVHRARLKTPKGVMDVVVKIQRPNIKDTIERDIDLMYWIARAVERSVTEAKIYQPVKLVAEFERAIAAELDYHQEADNAGRFERNFAGHANVKFPKVYKEASSRKVLTLEFLPGMKINDAVAAGYSGEHIAKNAVNVTIKQIFEDGFFHADPHPGNVLILGQPERPVLGIIDLGLVGRLTPQMRDKTIDLMVAVAREDPRGIADALYDLGKPTKKIDRNAYEAEVNTLSDKYLGKPLGEIHLSAMIRDLTQGAVKYGIEIPTDFLMVGKALMTIEGVGKQIYPELDVFEEVKPYFLKLFWQRYSPEKMSAELLRTANRLSGAANEIPIAFAEVLDDVRSGRLIVRTYEQSLADAYERVGRRIYSGLVVGSMIIASGIALAQKQLLVGAAFFVGGVVWGALHMGRLLFLRRRK